MISIFFQFHYFYKVFEKAKGMSNWTDSVYAFIKGPGWFPGTPRLGDPMGVPEVILYHVKLASIEHLS